MKNVDVEAAVATATAIPVKKIMTRTEKLTHWAGLVRKHPSTLGLYDSLEHRTYQHATMQVKADNTALGLAARDQALVDQGFTETTVAGAMTFFELSLDNLHAFSCNCGGSIGNADQANRIERLAGPTGGGLMAAAARLFS